MTIIDTFKIATTSIFRNKGRAVLTMLGVIIGVGSVVLLTSIGTGLKNYIEQQFESLGANIIYVVPGNPFGDGGSFRNPDEQVLEIAKQTLKESMQRQIARQLRSKIEFVVFSKQFSGTLTYKSEEKYTAIVGSEIEYQDVLGVDMEKGRWFDVAETRGGDRVVVLGNQLAQELFQQIDPIGKKVNINQVKFKVIGVAAKKGSFGGGPNFDNYAYIPNQTLSKVFDIDRIDNFSIKVKDKTDIPFVEKEVEKILLQDLDETDFTVFDQSQILDTINQILGVLTTGLGGIAAISLVVGGIGIMNIMLVSVTERTREIGLRKALGATPRQILLQFLVESATLSVIGGLIGVSIAVILSLILQQFFPSAVTLESILLAFGVSAAVGIFFGAAPAHKASKLSPIEALRSE